MLKFYSQETEKWIHVPVQISESQMNFITNLIEKVEEEKADKATVEDLQEQVNKLITDEDLDDIYKELSNKLDHEDLIDISNKFDALEEETDKIKDMEVSIEELIIEGDETKQKFIQIDNSFIDVNENLDKLGNEIQIVTEELADHYHSQYVEYTIFEESIDNLQRAIDKLEGGVVSGGVTQEEMIEALQIMQREIDLEMDELKKSVSDGKEKVADSITQKGVVTAPWETFQVMADNILKIEGDGSTGGGNSNILSIVKVSSLLPNLIRIPKISISSINEDLDIGSIEFVDELQGGFIPKLISKEKFKEEEK